MSKMKLRLIAIASLALLFVLTLSLAMGLPAAKASAAADPYRPDAIFSEGIDGTIVDTYTDEEGKTNWVEFSFKDGGSVEFQRSLAFKWFEAAEDASGSALIMPGTARYFSMEFSFPELLFDRFTVSFESAEENITKDGIATNKLVFSKTSTTLGVAILNASDERKEEDLTEEDYAFVSYTADAVVSVAFGESGEPGEFTVSVSVGEETAEGKFTNIGGNYAEYSNPSSSKPQVPLTFEAHLPEGAEKEQRLHMHSLNGQTFEVVNSRVQDNAKPVLVINEAVYAFRLGQRFSLTYTAMDVCRDRVDTTRRYYYMLEKDEEGNYKKPDLSTNSADYKTLSTSTHFMPTSDTEEEVAYVSIRFRLDDNTYSDYFVYLTWYAEPGAVQTFGNEGVTETVGYTCDVCGYECTVEEYEELTAEGKEFKCPGKIEEDANGDPLETPTDCTATQEQYTAKTETNSFDYIRVDREAKGPAFLNLKADEETSENTPDENYEAALDAYQTLVYEAAEKVSAGDGAYLYLPSLRGLIGSDYADYRNLTFSIYYYKPGTAAGGSASSSTSLRYNNLRIEVEEKGEYRFRVIAQDSAGNAMKYYDEDGKIVSLSSSNVWDIENVPEFNFIIGYSGPVIEEKDTQSPGRRDKTFTIPSFDIIALSGYKTEYKLYYYNAGEDGLSYSELVEAVKGVKQLDESIRSRLVEINPYNSDVTEDDDEWDRTDNAYAWNPDSSLSFCPQRVGYYLVEVVVTDAKLIGLSTTAYQAIEIEETSDTVPGRSPWLQNNLTAIILFSIAGVLFIALIIVFAIKPSDQTVEEVDLESLKKKKNKKENTDKPE